MVAEMVVRMRVVLTVVTVGDGGGTTTMMGGGDRDGSCGGVLVGIKCILYSFYETKNCFINVNKWS